MHRHGLTQGRGDRVPRGIPLLAETLEKGGYETVGFTANAYISNLTGLSRGFRHLEPTYDDGTGAHDAERARKALLRWLEDRRPDPAKEGPYFFFMNFMDTHQPLRSLRQDIEPVLDPAVTPEALQKAMQVDQRDCLAHLLGVRRLDEETLAGVRARYDGAARFLDRKTGEILDLLERKGFLRDALVIVTSDHGENLGEHGQMDHRLSVYDTLLHVPLVVRWPGRFEGGRVHGGHVSLMDLYPTILAAAKLEAPAGTGIDARPLPRAEEPGRLLLAESASAEAHLEEMREHLRGAPESLLDPLRVAIAAVRDPPGVPGGRKYLRFTRADPAGGEAVVREELYDAAADPGETRELLGTGDAEERAAADRLAAEIPRLRAAPR
jgi:arylsulfatase A-like enzyme